MIIGSDLAGRKFGQLVVLRRGTNHKGRWRWVCRCSCGAVTMPLRSALTTGRTKSCGGRAHSKGWVRNGHRAIMYEGREIPYSHVIWNAKFPNDPVKEGEVVHHKNERPLDDRVANYEKMTKRAHDILHRPALMKAVSRAKKGVRLTEEHCSKISVGLMDNPRLSWDPAEALRLRSLGLTQRSVAQMVGGDQAALQRYFKLREVKF